MVQNRSLRILALVGCLLMGALGCSRTYRIERGEHGGYGAPILGEYDSPARISAGERQIGILGPERHELTVESAGLPKDERGKPVFRVEFETPCGWQPVRSYSEVSGSKVTLHLPDARPLRLWYDNRGGAETEVQVGAARWRAPAGATGKVVLVTDGCDGEAEVRIGGENVGAVRVSPLSEVEHDLPAYVLDVTGGHCYAEQNAQYGSGPGSDAPTNLAGARVYPFSTISDISFPRRPDEQIQVTGQSASVRLQYVWDRPCEPRS